MRERDIDGTFMKVSDPSPRKRRGYFPLTRVRLVKGAERAREALDEPREELPLRCVDYEQCMRQGCQEPNPGLCFFAARRAGT